MSEQSSGIVSGPSSVKLWWGRSGGPIAKKGTYQKCYQMLAIYQLKVTIRSESDRKDFAR